MRLSAAALLLCLAAVPAFAGAQAVPDDAKTPGVWRTDLTPDQIKTTKWGSDERAVTAAMRAEVDKLYSTTGTHDASCGSPRCELDHRFPRCLGGADDVRNLWMQAAPYWHEKDRVEDDACKEFREGRMTLEAARAIFAGDWRVRYKVLFGADP